VQSVVSMTQQVLHPVCHRHCKTVLKMAIGKCRVSKMFFHFFCFDPWLPPESGHCKDALDTFCLCFPALAPENVSMVSAALFLPHMSNGWSCDNLSFMLSNPNYSPFTGTCYLADYPQPVIQLSPVTGMFW